MMLQSLQSYSRQFVFEVERQQKGGYGITMKQGRVRDMFVFECVAIKLKQ